MVQHINIELRRISHNKRLSEETEAFAADLYLDGKKAGEVSNDGHGGPHRFSDYEAEKRLQDYAKTLPIKVTDIVMDGTPFEFQPDADSLVSDALDLALNMADMKRALKKKAVYVAEDGKLYAIAQKGRTPDQIIGNPAEFKAKHKATAILNLLFEDDALELYRKHG